MEVFFITRSVPKFLTYEVVIEAIREAFAITLQPRSLVAIERTTIFVGSSFGWHHYRLFE
jgi:hypothetical protein